MKSISVNNVDFGFKRKIVSKAYLFFAALMTLILFYLSLETNKLIFSFIGTVIIIGNSFYLDTHSLAGYFFYLLPNQRLLVLNEGGITVLNILLVIMFFKDYVFNNNKMKLDFLLLLFLFTLLSVFHSYSYVELKSITISLSIVVLFLSFVIKKEGCYFYHNSFINGILLMGFLGLIFDPFVFKSSNYRFSGSLYNNPNDFSVLIIFAMIYSYAFFHHSRNKIYILKMLFLILFGVMTQSRTFALGFILLTFFHVFMNDSTSVIKKIGENFWLVLVVFLFLKILNTTIFEGIFTTYLNRIFNPRNEDITGGRRDLMYTYIEFFRRYPRVLIFGSGYSLKVILESGITQVPHNFLIELILIEGIVGTMLVTVIFRTFRKQILYGKVKKSLSIKGVFPFIVLYLISLTRHSPLNISFISIYYLNTLLIKEFT